MLNKGRRLGFFVIALGVVGFLGFSPIQGQAAVSPLSISVFNPVQFPPQDFTVAGLRLNVLYGSHRKVYGFDFGGIASVTEQNFAGVAVAGGMNYVKGSASVVGLQAAGIGNRNVNNSEIYGLQVAGLFNSNVAETTLVGLQLAALANFSAHTKVYGVQVSLYNQAAVVNGFQIGLVNVADSLHGLQIGLINFHRKGIFAVSPILNFGF